MFKKKRFILLSMVMLITSTTYSEEVTKPDKDSVPEIEGMVLVKGGCYDMGDTFGEGSKNEKPVHEVCIDDFQMGKYEVTQAEWMDVMGNNPSKFKNCDRCPVEQVSWNDVQNYISKLNRKTGRNYRLPTEAEWEYAARSGGKKERYAGFSDKNLLYEYANFCDSNCEEYWKEKGQDDGYKNTSPVGSYRPNGLGLYDMSGNVMEMVSDRYSDGYYKKSPKNRPQGPSNGEERVVRGGAWASITFYTRSAYRYGAGPTLLGNSGGFRLAAPSP